MKLFLLFLGVTLAACADTSSGNSYHWEQSSSNEYAYVNGKPVVIKKPMEIVKDPQPSTAATDESANPDDQKIEKSKDSNDPAKLRYPNFYPGNGYPYPYPDLGPYQLPYPEIDPGFRAPYPGIDPGFGRPDLWNPRPVFPFDRRYEDNDFQLW